MPRPNRGRTLNVEASVARRIAYERDRRNWTNDGLASRMTLHGCGMHPSAIHKILRLDQPRRITANELAAFAEVFEIGLDELIKPPEVLLEGRAKATFEQWANAVAESDRAHQELARAEAEVVQLLAANPDAKDPVEQAVRVWVKNNYGYVGEDGPVEAMMRQFREPRRSEPVNEAAVTAYLNQQGEL
jgi:transcriptional regulator with XRE-family HTH domain